MVHQLVSLERRTARGGNDSIDHPRGAHDDIANACAGAVVMCAERPAGWRRRDREVDRALAGSSIPLIRSARSSSGYIDPNTAWMWKR
jgi:hypothetical protein